MVTFFIHRVDKIYQFNFNTVIMFNIMFAYTMVRVAQIKYNTYHITIVWELLPK